MAVEHQSIQQVSQLLDLFEKHVAGGNIELKTCSIESIARVLERLAASASKLENSSWTNILQRIWLRVLDHSNDRGFETGRTKAATALGPFTDVLVRHKTAQDSWRHLVDAIQGGIRETLKEEKSAMVLRVLDPAAARLLQL